MAPPSTPLSWTVPTCPIDPSAAAPKIRGETQTKPAVLRTPPLNCTPVRCAPLPRATPTISNATCGPMTARSRTAAPSAPTPQPSSSTCSATPAHTPGRNRTGATSAATPAAPSATCADTSACTRRRDRRGGRRRKDGEDGKRQTVMLKKVSKHKPLHQLRSQS